MSKDYRRFIITGDARTGSNMLAQALNSNASVRCFREVFHYWQQHVDYFIEGYDPDSVEDRELRQSDPVRFLHERIFTDFPGEVRAVGFKYLYGHFWGFDALTDYLSNDRDVLVIHLKRRNLLRSLISLRIAEHTNRWIEDWGIQPKKRPLVIRAFAAALQPRITAMKLRRMMSPPPPEERKPELVLPKDECTEFFARTRREVERVDTMFSEHRMLTVLYEDMAAQRDETFSEVQRFLRVEPAELVVTLRKQNPEPMRKLVKNYDDLRRAFAGTPEAVYFDE